MDSGNQKVAYVGTGSGSRSRAALARLAMAVGLSAYQPLDRAAEVLRKTTKNFRSRSKWNCGRRLFGRGTAKNYNDRPSAKGWNHYSDRCTENGWNAVGHR